MTELRLREANTALWSLDLTSGTLSELFGPSPLARMLAGDACTLEECLARVHRDDVSRLRAALETAYQGGNYEQRFRMFDQVGDERWLYARATYLGGDRPRLVGIVDDMTEHVQLVRRLADRRRIEAAQGRQVNELAAKLVSATTVQEVTNLLSREFTPIFGGDGAHVVLLDDTELRLYPESTASTGQWLYPDNHRDSAHPVGAVLHDSQPRFFESRSELLERFPALGEALCQTDDHSWAFVPMFGDGKTAIGVWVVAWTQPHHATPDERALLLTLAGLAGQALQRVNRQSAELELADASNGGCCPRSPPPSPNWTWPCATFPPELAGGSAATSTTPSGFPGGGSAWWSETSKATGWRLLPLWDRSAWRSAPTPPTRAIREPCSPKPIGSSPKPGRSSLRPAATW